MILMELYSKEKGTLKKFPSVNTVSEARAFIGQYCKDNGVKVIATERCDTSYWNYLSDKTEIDYTIVDENE